MKFKRMTNFVITVAFAISLAACSTINPYTGEQQTSKVAKGAGIGAAAGAVVGLISGNSSRERRERALIGAGLGAIAGGGIGYYMDVQEAKLRQTLSGTGVSVTRDGDNIILNMPSNITFGVNSADISSDFYEVLDSVTIVVNEYDKTLIEVMGHTDNTGSEQHNQQLSDRRARSVTDYLASREINSVRLEAYGYGEGYPVANNDTDQGRAKNRRVEIALVPITSS
jgi:outer membrane protein OmpA-like peptidoglycan-associated protein|tara:strand:+ start:391 stop:1068 length:678 start_codon:yes stop_codon:yes gene_type:complete